MRENKEYLGTATNKKAWDFWNRYEKTPATDDSVLTVYGRCSTEKIESENKIKREMTENAGHGYKVLGHNTFSYSCGYIIDISNITKLLIVHTPGNRYKILFNGVYMK